jgi:hypothetical protein
MMSVSYERFRSGISWLHPTYARKYWRTDREGISFKRGTRFVNSRGNFSLITVCILNYPMTVVKKLHFKAKRDEIKDGFEAEREIINNPSTSLYVDNSSPTYYLEPPCG